MGVPAAIRPMTGTTIDYGNLMHRAMRGLIQNVLVRVAAEVSDSHRVHRIPFRQASSSMCRARVCQSRSSSG